MSKAFISANRIAAVKIESDPGVFESVLPADYKIEFYDLAVPSFERNPTRLGKPAVGNLLQGRSSTGLISGTGYALKCALKHSGNETQTPALDPLLLAAGLWRGFGPDGEIVYTFDGTAPCTTLSVEVSDFNCGRTPDAVTVRGRGAAANLTLTGSGIGEKLDATFELSMAFESRVDNPSPARVLVGQDAGQAEKLLGTTFLINSQAYLLHNFTLNMNNEISMIADPSKPGGVYRYQVVGTDPVLNVSVSMLKLSESQLEALIARDADTDAETITIDGRSFKIEIDKANLRNLSQGDAAGIMTDELEIEVRGFRISLKEEI